MKVTKMLVAATMLTAVSAMTAQAQSGTCGPDGSGNLAINATACARTHDVTTTVNDILQLTLNSSSTNLGNPTIANYGPLATYASAATPLPASAGPNVKIVANRAYELSIAATTATFGPSGVNKPSTDVEWTKVGGTYAGLSTGAAQVLASTQGTADTNTDLSFRSRWAFERDVPGAYTLTLQLTLAAK
jgi:hypothetical protein